MHVPSNAVKRKTTINYNKIQKSTIDIHKLKCERILFIKIENP